MNCKKNLLDALEECGEAAAFYEGQHFLMANSLFAGLFERGREDFEGLPIVQICHNESIEMIQDFIRRRAHEDIGVPTVYECAVTAPGNPKFYVKVIALKMKKGEGSVLVIVREK